MDENQNCQDSKGDQINLQDPNQEIKPTVTIDRVPELITSLYGIKSGEIKQLPSYDDLNFFFTGELDGTNPHLDAINEHGYVMKILNTLQSSQPAIIEANHAFQAHLRERGISSQVPILNKNGKEFSLERVIVNEKGTTVELGPYIIRVVTFIPGVTFFNTPYVPGSFYNTGKFLGRFNEASRTFRHPFFDTYKHIWSLTEVPALKDFVYAVKDSADAAIVNECITAFETEVKPRFKEFTEGVVHGDVNEQNLVMMEVPGQNEIPRESRIHDVSGILDFSDGTMSYFVLDAAICIAYLSIECSDEEQVNVGGHILAGYLQYFSLNDAEMECLPILVCCRLCQSLVFGAHSYLLQPGNEYLLTTSSKGWPLLRKFWKIDKNDLLQTWRKVISTYNDKP